MESSHSIAGAAGLWDRYAMALEDVASRLRRICQALNQAGVPFALVGGQAVALWVASRDPAAVRTTKDVDVLLRRDDLGRARGAALTAGMDYFEALGVGMFLDQRDPNPRHAVQLVWAGEPVRPGHAVPAPTIEQRETTPDGWPVVTLAALVQMKLQADRDQDRVHLRDMIDVGLVGRELLPALAPTLARRLDVLLSESGR